MVLITFLFLIKKNSFLIKNNMNDEAIKLLQQIAENTSHKTSFQVIVSGNKSSFNTLFNPKIELDTKKVYEIALVNLETYY